MVGRVVGNNIQSVCDDILRGKTPLNWMFQYAMFNTACISSPPGIAIWANVVCRLPQMDNFGMLIGSKSAIVIDQLSKGECCPRWYLRKKWIPMAK